MNSKIFFIYLFNSYQSEKIYCWPHTPTTITKSLRYYDFLCLLLTPLSRSAPPPKFGILLQFSLFFAKPLTLKIEILLRLSLPIY